MTLQAIQYITDFDALGHLDYIIRYLPSKSAVNAKDYKEWIMPILQCLVDMDKALEMNTSGYKRGLGMPNPDIEILKWYLELGGTKVTVGSDAHSPEYLGDHFDTLEELLKKNGLHHYTMYRGRKPIQINI
jgi:histidinol-phosphatase (PHP family)